MTNPIDAVKTWLWTVALKKGVYSLVQVIVGFITSIKVVTILRGAGIEVDPVALAGFLTAAITGGLTMLQNWIKTKYGVKWL